tara:strand:+ start:1470 stop:2813 length:1344 start_codon:yes stop_codon:yes gene_type:complete
MSSTFTRIARAGQGPDKEQDVYLQFVPGIVVDTVTSGQSKLYNQDFSNINTIIAMPHISETPLKETMLNEKFRYKPLLRGIVDVPSKGDPVLLCTIAGINYYLGPLNTQGDVNFNIDHAKKKDIQIVRPKDSPQAKMDPSRKPTERETMGLGSFPIRGQARLVKQYNDELDNPMEIDKMPLMDIPGDLMLEGRFGNGIRIGSRWVNPYVMISNRRAVKSATETTRDGALIFLSSAGTIREHFKNDVKFNAETEETEPTEFVLSDSTIEEPLRNIQQTFSTGQGRGILNDDEKYDSEIDIYEYKNPQMLLASERLIFNARNDSIFMSAFQFLHFGAGNTITFSTSNNFLISAETRTVIDSPIIKLGTDNNEDTEPLVLGDELVNFLKNLMNAIKKMNDTINQQVFATGAGPTAVGPTNAAAFSAINTIDIKKLEDTIEDILSQTNRTT